MAQASHQLTHNRFKAWLDRHGMSVSEAAEALGVDRRTISNWKVKEPPKVVLMACAAYSVGLKPIE